MRHAKERDMALYRSGAGSHKSTDFPVGMTGSFSPAVGTAWKQKWMAKSSLAVHWPGKHCTAGGPYSPSPFYLEQEVSSN